MAYVPYPYLHKTTISITVGAGTNIEKTLDKNIKEALFINLHVKGINFKAIIQMRYISPGESGRTLDYLLAGSV